MRKRTQFAIAAACLLAAAAFYATPYWALNQMRAAAQNRDADKLNTLVDFPAVRADLKTAISAKISTQMNKSEATSALSALGSAMVETIVNPMVDALITPENLAQIMRTPESAGKTTDTPPTSAPPKNDQPSNERPNTVETTMGYTGFNEFVVHLKRHNTDKEIRLILKREGLIQWKLAGLRLPL